MLASGLSVRWVLADTGGGTPASDVSPDPISDAVSATAAEFRVDESGAATYSIPITTVPGTAGVAPQMTLNYSSQAGYGPMGKGWSIGGASAITRCRATREAGDFIAGGVPTDGNSRPINFTSTDRFCLDGQRLIPGVGGTACPAVSGMAVQTLRTEIESFQRVCAYSPGNGANGPAFFTVERKDGSTSWYGDRDNSTSGNRADGYVDTNATEHAGKALMWAQTRFQDSTGNYIDYLYDENPGTAAGSAEHLLREVRYTGKRVLPGQTGNASPPYARVVFNYTALPSAKWSIGYQPGGATHTQRYRLTSVNSCASVSSCAAGTQARHYALTYSTSASGSQHDLLTSIQECRDSSKAVCMAPTTFAWSGGRHEFATVEKPANLTLANDHIRGFKTGDINGDGRQDLAVLYLAGSGCVGGTWVVNAMSTLSAAGVPTFSAGHFNCVPANIVNRGDGAWHLFDYNGDGRDDLFVSSATGQGWRLHPGTDTGFNMTVNLISGLSPAIPSVDAKESQVQLADLNGDGLVDIVYPAGGGLRARIMQRQGANYAWGAERTVLVSEASLGASPCQGLNTQVRDCIRTISGVPTSKTGFMQMADFNGDAASDLLIRITTSARYWTGYPGCMLEPLSRRGGQTSEDGWLGDYYDPDGFMTAAGPINPCYEEVRTDSLYAMVVETVGASTITVSNYGVLSTGNPEAIVLADINGDGLSDAFTRSTANSDWYAAINTGRGFTSVGGGVLALSGYREHARFADVNGDGRTDMLYPVAVGANKVYHVRYAQSGGGFAAGVALPGGNARLCEGANCNPAQRAPMFLDLDGDGNLDFLSFNFGSGNLGLYVSRSNARFEPRDVLTSITNGFGARTDIRYAPLTNKDLYRRDSGARVLNWGRGSPVMDWVAPIYAAASVSSSSPQPGLPNAMATVHYRYAGAKVQAGGRGFLGFREIVTFDGNHVGGHVATITTYAQNFPFTGMPMSTVKRAMTGAYSTPACLASSAMTNGCFGGPGETFPALGGSMFSTAIHEWEADTDIAAAVRMYAAGEQRPIHVRTLGTGETVRDPFTNTTTSRIETAFDYGAYGHVTMTNVDTYSGGGTLVSTVNTSNAYSTSGWKLGRLTSSTVTHSRPSRDSIVRTASFAYDLSGGNGSGQLIVERVQSGGGGLLDLRTNYALDQYGNRVRSTTCAAPATNCTTAAFEFMPVDRARVNRYTRTVYDSVGRYPVETWAPFRSAGGSAEVRTGRVMARDLFGNVTRQFDVNGRDSFAVYGALGRPFYAWTETVPGSVPGNAAGGVGSWTHYRWCGSGVSCPTGAKVRQVVTSTGAPAQWTYLDQLGRPILVVTQSFNVGVSGKDASGVCTAYDAVGRVTGVSNPFFLPGTASTAGGAGPTVSTGTCTQASLKWTTTAYDLLGRPIRVTGPDGSYATTSYSGLTTTGTDPRGKATAELRNALGELVRVTDALGTATSYAYGADGTLLRVDRDSGRGVVRNSFQYDVQGRKVRQVDPDAGTTDFEFNALGELITQTHADGSRIENELDAQGRIWRKTVRTPTGVIESQSTYTFDIAANGRGQLAQETISGRYAGWANQAGTELSFSRTYRYDLLGRSTGSTTMIDGNSYGTEVEYDALGRAWKAQDASGLWSKTAFNSRGMPTATCSSSFADIAASCPTNSNTYRRTRETDAWGNVVLERRGEQAAMDVVREYWADTGRVSGVCAGDAQTCNLMDEGYAWDAAGNLHTHVKETRYMETFTYDALNRLSSAKLAIRNGQTVNQTLLAQSYDRLGNPCRRDEDGGRHDYVYGGRSGCGLGDGNSGFGSGSTTGARAHSVFQYRDMSYTYDARGNQVGRSGGSAPSRTIRYSRDDHAHEITMGNGVRARFWYGSDGQRYKREDQDGKRTLYLGNVEVVVQGSAQTIRRMLAGVMQQTIVGSSATNRYLFHDHLGSLVRITNASGVVQSSQDYRAYGSRRSYTSPTAAGTASAFTPRGYTGHEHLDGLDVIHMNGRIYDPALHRFLQPDPVIQAPGNLQGWNAYTYVFNNPLVYTDPSGMISLRQVLGIVIAVVGTYVTAGMDGGFFAKMGMAMAFGAASGYTSTGTWQGAMWGAFSAAAFYGVGSYFENVASLNSWAGTSTVGSTGLTAGNLAAKTLMHGVAGGVMSDLQGGKFGHGFASAGVTQAFSPGIDQIGGGARSYAGARIAAAAVLGGTASKLSGGNFANGAVTAAFSRAFNDEFEHRARANDARGMKFDVSDPKYHIHQFEDLICMADSVCSLGSVALASRLHPAPGTFSNKSPIADGQYGIAQLGYPVELDNFGPIVHSVSADGLIIRNSTVSGHLLHPGYVERQVFQRAGGIYIRTTGEGMGNHGVLNNSLSRPMWNGLVNSHVRYRVSSDYGK